MSSAKRFSRVAVVLSLLFSLVFVAGSPASAGPPTDSRYRIGALPVTRSSIDTAISPGGPFILFSDPVAHVVRAWTFGRELVVVGNGSSGLPIAGSPSDSPMISPTDLAYDTETDTLYIVDTGANMVLRVDGLVGDNANAQVSIVAGTGVAGDPFLGFFSPPFQASTSKLDAPHAIAQGPDGLLYISDTGNDRVVVVDTTTDVISAVTGPRAETCDGDTGSVQPSVSAPRGLLVDPTSGALIIADTGNHRIMRWTPGSAGVPCEFTTIAGTGEDGPVTAGPATESELSEPVGIDFYAGVILVADSGNHQLLAIDADGAISVLAGNGSPDPMDVTSTEDPLSPASVSLGTISQAKGLGFAPAVLLIDATNNIFALLVPSQAPNNPTALAATVGDGSASVSFTPPTANGGRPITKYQYKVGNDSWTDAVGTTSPITISGLPNYQISRIRLRAVNSIGEGEVSDPVQVWPRRAGSSLTSVRATSRTSIRAAFAALNPVGGTVRHYWVYAYAKGTTTVAGSCRSTAAARSCVIAGLSAGTEYDVAVRGFFTLTGSPTVLPTLDSNSIRVRTKN